MIRKTEAGWEEWFTEKQLQQLTQKYPTRYQKTEKGSWICPPGIAHAELLGLKYYVRSDAGVNPIFIQNLIFLEDYLKFTSSVSAPFQQQIAFGIKATPGITITNLINNEPKIRANDIYTMIANDGIYTDLTAAPLKEHNWVQLYPNHHYHDAILSLRGKNNTPHLNKTSKLVANTPLVWDGRLWTLVNLGDTTATLLPETGEVMQLPSELFHQLLSNGSITITNTSEEGKTSIEVQNIINKANPTDLALANERLSHVLAYLQRQTDGYSQINQRTLRRWVFSYRMAEVNYGCGYIGLLPKTSLRGNRKPKAEPNSTELLDSFIEQHFETPRQAPAASVFRAYVRACEQKNIKPLSRSTFYQRLKKRRSPKQIEKRLGRKVAYIKQPWHWQLTYTTPTHGDRPLSIVHIDHTLLDIELLSSTNGRLLGRPWLTILMDAYSRRILAVYLTFDPPSYRTCMMALRICVQRFGRFPQAMVVDGGKEFHSIYFDTLLARYHCTKKTRPTSCSRFGSVIERLFGTTNTQFIFNLKGNTQATKKPRTLTKDINPKNHALWTLGDLYTYLTQWAYEVYDETEHPVLGTTPRCAYELGLKLSGEREHRQIQYNQEFILATHPSTRNGVAKIQPGRGIKLNYIYYWNDAWSNPEIEGKKVPIRYDPMDIGVAYAYSQGRWLKCISQYYSIFCSHSEKELLLATAEIKRLGKLTRSSTSISAVRLADFISNVQDHETLLLQRLKDLEMPQILNAPSTHPEPITDSPKLRQSNHNDLSGIAPQSPESKDIGTVSLDTLPIFEEYN